MNYTKGKWSLTGKDDSGAANIFTDKEDIATVRHEYDAYLIVAAPDMYEALKQIASCETHADGDVVDIARKALAKAENR